MSFFLFPIPLEWFHRGRRCVLIYGHVSPAVVYKSCTSIHDWNKRNSAGHVDPLGCSSMFWNNTLDYFKLEQKDFRRPCWSTWVFRHDFPLRQSMIDGLCFLSFVMQATPFVYLLDLTCPLMEGSQCKHHNTNCLSPLLNVVSGRLSQDPKHMLCSLSLRTRSSYPFLIVCICFRWREFCVSRYWSSCRIPKSCPSSYGNLSRVKICISFSFKRKRKQTAVTNITIRFRIV